MAVVPGRYVLGDPEFRKVYMGEHHTPEDCLAIEVEVGVYSVGGGMATCVLALFDPSCE